MVLALSSSEYPIAVIGCEEQGLAVAFKVKGEVTVAPLTGLVTVTAPEAGTAQINAAVLSSRKRAFIQGPNRSSEHTWSSCKIWLALERRIHTPSEGAARELSVDLFDRLLWINCLQDSEKVTKKQ